MQWSVVECSGGEWNSVEYSGVQWSEVECVIVSAV